MFRRSAFTTLLVVLILTAATQPAFASQVKPSSAGALIQGLEIWLARWAPWVGGDAASARGIGASAEPGEAAADRAGQEPGEAYRPIAGHARVNRAGQGGTPERHTVPKCSGATDPNGVCH
jgi:hypothetical protein